MFTSAQYLVIKNYILADPVMSVIPAGPDGDYAIADLLNQTATPDFMIWNPVAAPNDIINAIDWSKYTPNSTVPTDTQLNVDIWRARLDAACLKQSNIWALLDVTNGSIDATKPNIRAGLRDAVISIPTGAAGANVHPGGASGVDVLTACTRKALLIEKVLTLGSATTGTVTADLPGYVGTIQYQFVTTARES
jgi:hypothetical protein